MKQLRLLWLDDVRNPMDEIWQDWMVAKGINPDEWEITWVKSYDAFTNYITNFGMPDLICFDHDLGDDVRAERVANGMSKRQARIKKRETMSGFECTKWLVDYCIDNDVDLPRWEIQSANPVGAENIQGLLVGYLKHSNKF